jgi:hypothetical protein
MRNTGFSLREQTLLCAKGAAPLWTPKTKAPTSWAWGSLRSLPFGLKTQRNAAGVRGGLGARSPQQQVLPNRDLIP